MTALPELTEEAVAILSARAGELGRLLAGAARFPMRPIGREGDDVLRHEAEIRRRYEAGENNLFRLTRDPKVYLDDPRHPIDAALHRFFVLNEATPRPALAALLGAAILDELMGVGFLAEEDGRLRSLFRLVSVGGLLLVADAWSRAPDLVYLSDDSFYLAERLPLSLAGRHFESVVDLGCGSGVIGLAAARLFGLAGGLRGLDLNPRALHFAAANARIAGIAVALEETSFAAASGFAPRSLVLANPPFVFQPEGDERLHSRAGDLGLEHALAIVAMLDRELGRKSEAAILCSSPVLVGATRPVILERLAPQRIDILVETAGSHPPFARHADFYAEAGIASFRQLLVRARPGTGRVDHDPRPRGRPWLFG